MLLVGLTILFLVVMFWPASPLIPLPRDTKLAVWMGVTWSMDMHTDAEIVELAEDLKKQEVSDVYVYVSYLKTDDTFNATYDYAVDFTRHFQAAAPDITLYAWLGVPISIERPDGSFVANRLNDAAIRQQIADFALKTVTELGFDGVHLNAELIPDGDEGFLQTLAAIRTVLPEGTPFSSTAHALRLQENVTLVPYPQVAHHWTPSYLQHVANYTDQIALMAYDSGLPFPRDYRAWVYYQTRAAAVTLADTNVELMIGLPVSEEWTWSHQTQAETLSNALDGLSSGFADETDGIALYAHWEISDAEWEAVQVVRP
jgi:spore germination protein YaaH